MALKFTLELLETTLTTLYSCLDTLGLSLSSVPQLALPVGTDSCLVVIVSSGHGWVRRVVVKPTHGVYDMLSSFTMLNGLGPLVIVLNQLVGHSL